MTLNEFRDMAAEGVIVCCRTVEMRKNVLELFEECGICISAASSAYLRPGGDANIEYMHPSIKPGGLSVSCYRSFSNVAEQFAHPLQYEDVQDLIENLPPLDVRSDAEFEKDFASLLC